MLAGSDYGRDAATTASSVNSSLVAAAMVEAAAKAAGKEAARPEVLTYIWLWPSAKPVSADQLTASVQVPAAMGADGVILWGASADAHVSGYSQTINGFLKSTAGPLITKCAADRAQCASALCSGHGRCSNYDADHPEKGCSPPESADSVVCVCDAGFAGAKCDKSA